MQFGIELCYCVDAEFSAFHVVPICSRVFSREPCELIHFTIRVIVHDLKPNAV
jgi:hypothetical protein